MNFVYSREPNPNNIESFSLARLQYDGEPMVSVVGHFTGMHINQFRQLVDEVATECPRRILINMEGLSFIDSLGIGVLIFYHNQLRRSGVEIALFKPSVPLEEILRLTSLDRVIPIVV